MNVFKNCIKLRLASPSVYLPGMVVQPAVRPSLLPWTYPASGVGQPALLHTSPTWMDKRFVTGKKGSVSRAHMRDKEMDPAQDEALNIDVLEEVEVESEKAEFTLYPDENTENLIFDGIKFKDLPYVTMVLHRNNTRLIARHADQRLIYVNSPSMHGFLNAKKRTNVAGQVAGLNMGQKLRSLGIKHVRVRINGFNAARVSTVKGIAQAGIEIVCLSDVTRVEWNWPQRARAKPSKN